MAAEHLTVEKFRSLFREFSEDAVESPTVEARLDEAREATPIEIWGGLTSDGHGHLAAHLLTTSGYGREVSKDGTTTYGRRRLQLEALVGTAHAPRST